MISDEQNEPEIKKTEDKEVSQACYNINDFCVKVRDNQSVFFKKLLKNCNV